MPTHAENLANLAAAAVASMSNRNILHNGDIRIQQRGATFNAATEAQLTFDRWRATIGGAGTVNITEGGGYAGLSRFSVNAARSAGTGVFGVYQSVERNEFERLKGKTVTFSGALSKNASLAGSITCEIVTVTAEGGTTAVESASTVIAAAGMSGVTKFSVSLDIPGGTAALGILVRISATSQAGGANVGFSATCLQLEVGKAATPYEWRPTQIELALCQRFYQSVYAHWSGATTNAQTYSIGLCAAVPMRAAPTCTSVADGPNIFFPLANVADIASFYAHGTTYFIVTRTANATNIGTFGGAYKLSADL